MERHILLCERSLILMDFDFVRLEIRQLFIYDYSRFNSIRIGPLIYPQMALNWYVEIKFGRVFLYNFLSIIWFHYQL